MNKWILPAFAWFSLIGLTGVSTFARDLNCAPSDLGRTAAPPSDLHIVNSLRLSPDGQKLIEVDSRGQVLSPQYQINQIKRSQDLIEVSGLHSPGTHRLCAGGCAQTFFVLQIQMAAHSAEFTDSLTDGAETHLALLTMTQRHFDEELGLVMQRTEPTQMRCTVEDF
jgi:hypothetical protein